MRRRSKWFCTLIAAATCGACVAAHDSQAADDPNIAAVRAGAEQLTKAFNAGKVDDLVKLFIPTAELIDDNGTIYRGQQEIKDLLTSYFKQYPGARRRSRSSRSAWPGRWPSRKAPA